MRAVALAAALLLAVNGPVAAVEPLSGRASWYYAPIGRAAAGPALRRWLGQDWRGRVVRVRANGRSVRVRLTDWCQCYRGTARERVIDLARWDFARLASPSVGVLRVTIEAVQ